MWPPSWSYMYVHPADCLAIRGFDLGLPQASFPNWTRVDYEIDVPAEAAGNYYVHLRDFGATSSDDSVYVSIDGDTTVSQTVTALRSLDSAASAKAAFNERKAARMLLSLIAP